MANEKELIKTLEQILSDVETGPLSDVGAGSSEYDADMQILHLYEEGNSYQSIVPYMSIDVGQLARELIASEVMD